MLGAAGNPDRAAFASVIGSPGEQDGTRVTRQGESVVFLAPGIDDGFLPLGSEGGDLQPGYAPPAWLGAVVAASHPEQALDLYRFIRNVRANRTARHCVVFKSIPVVVEDFGYRGKIPTVSDRVLLTGASAMRVRMKLAKQHPEDQVEADLEAQRVTDRAAARRLGRGRALSDSDRRLPFVIECRNFFNFYHFTTESLIYLQMVRDYGLQGEICLITSSQKPVKPFIEAAVRDFYPDLAGRVRYMTGPASFARAIIPYNTNHLYHQANDRLIEDIELKAGFAGVTEAGALRPPTIENYKIIYNNSRDDYLDRHRAAVLGETPETLPAGTRLYVGRKPGSSRDRALVGEEALRAMLARYGFQDVYLEDLTPREQARLCHSAEIFLSAHGAGFANMLYALPGAWFVELSHLQTARHRFGDFNMHAAVSGARYLHFFADHAWGEGPEVPSMDEDGHSGIALSDAAIDRLEGLVAMLADPAGYARFYRSIGAALDKGDGARVRTLLAGSVYRFGCARSQAIAAEACLLMDQPQAALAHLRQALEIAPYRADLWQKRQDLARQLGLEAEIQAARQGIEDFRPFRWMRWHSHRSGAALIQHPQRG